MGGFQLNGCGAKDYFKKEKYLGEQMCPNCNMLTPFYLNKGKFKVSVFWIPTVTLKERYAILCEKCEMGQWIEDAEAYKLLGAGTVANEVMPLNKDGSSARKCPQCGAEVVGPFCGKCGTKYEAPVVIAETTGKVCPQCGAEVVGPFCGKCGTKYEETDVIEEKSKNVCPQCGAEVVGPFCGKCGAKHEETDVIEEKPENVCPQCGAEVVGPFCGKCGASCKESAGTQEIPDEKEADKDIGEETDAPVDEQQENGEPEKLVTEPASELQNQVDKETEKQNAEQEWECPLCGASNPENSRKCDCGFTKDEI